MTVRTTTFTQFNDCQQNVDCTTTVQFDTVMKNKLINSSE